MSFKVLIPARLGSTRLKQKLLLPLGNSNKTIIQYVYEAGKASGANEVIIATDSKEIQQVCLSFGAKVCMTSSKHQTGTDRIAEAVKLLNIPDNEIIINLQGDEPLISLEIIKSLVNTMQQNLDTEVATVVTNFNSVAEFFSPNIVKVIANKNLEAMLFTRSPCPWDRDNFDYTDNKTITVKKINLLNYYRHIGIYGYRAGFLQDYTKLSAPPLEQLEKLEQLRILWHGYKLKLAIVPELQHFDINTYQDYLKVRDII